MHLIPFAAILYFAALIESASSSESLNDSLLSTSSAATVKAVAGNIDAWLPSPDWPDYVKCIHTVEYLVG